MKNSILILLPTIFQDFNNSRTQSALLFSISSAENYTLKFEGYKNNLFKKNLSFADISLTKLLPDIAEILYRETNSLSNRALCQQLLKKNVLEIDKGTHSHIYQHKIKFFLKTVLQGLNASSVWHVDAQKTHDFSLAKTVGNEVFLFHSSDFLEYLFTHTHLSVVSSETIRGKHLTNAISELKLNLQIRFFD